MQTTKARVMDGPRGPLTLHRVTDARVAAHISSAVRDMAFDDNRATRFPGPNPVSLDTGHYPALRSQPYYVCEKTDGVRFLLLCCTVPAAGTGELLKVCALVDRAMTAYLAPLRHVPRAMFQGSLLDGELVWNKADERWEYLVFDAVCVSGVPVMTDGLRDRLEAVHAALRVYAWDPRDPLALRVKSFIGCGSGNWDALDDHMAEAAARYDVDGVILTPALAPVVYGRHNGMFKLKFEARHTVDFLVGGDGRQLLVFDAGTHAPVGRLAGPAAAPGCIAECSLAGGDAWDLVLVRTDKTTANDMFTYRKTLLNMEEALTLDAVKRVFA